MVSEFENKPPDELRPVWERTDDLLENFFSGYPSPKAEVQISFNYEGYRITVDQRGIAWFEEREP